MSDPIVAEEAFEYKGLHNLRDLGGLHVRGGGHLRSGVLIRSDSLHAAEPEDVDHLLNTVGLVSILDLRSARELDLDGTNELIPATVAHHHFPIAGGPGGAIEGAPAGERLAARYLEYLDNDTHSIIGAIRTLANGRGGATIVHCRVGKDRTGIVIALVLAAVGVEPGDIARDYELTTEPMKRLMVQLRASATYAANVSLLPDEMYSSQARTMLSFLGQLDSVHGGAANWMLGHGLAPAELQALTDQLVTDDRQPHENKEHSE